MDTHYKGTEEEIKSLDCYTRFTRAADTLPSRVYQQSLAPHGLTLSQFGTLEILYHRGPMCPGEIGQRLLKTGGNMTMVIDNLEKGGLVRRERDSEDRRQIFISLTETGEALISRILPEYAAAVAEELSILTQEEQEELGRLCRLLERQSDD